MEFKKEDHISSVINKTICFFFILIIIINIVWYYIILPDVVGKRAEGLGYMEYDSVQGKMVGKDIIESNKWELHYLQHGKMN